MKRIITLALIALLGCLPLAACAETHTVEGLYSIEYDESKYILDTKTYLSDSADGYTWLFMLYNDDIDIDASMTKLDNYEGFSLYNATGEERDRYLKDTLDYLSDYDGEYLSTIETGSEGAIVPFYVYSCRDDKGGYLLAETIASGYALNFHCYYEDSKTDPNEALYEALSEVLVTFAPVR